MVGHTHCDRPRLQDPAELQRDTVRHGISDAGVRHRRQVRTMLLCGPHADDRRRVPGFHGALDVGPRHLLHADRLHRRTSLRYVAADGGASGLARFAVASGRAHWSAKIREPRCTRDPTVFRDDARLDSRFDHDVSLAWRHCWRGGSYYAQPGLPGVPRTAPARTRRWRRATAFARWQC